MWQELFSSDYVAAAQRFESASKKLHEVGLEVIFKRLPIDEKGPSDETLAIDIAWIGPKNASKLILHTSGIHGVEGYAGSAIQLYLMERLIENPKILNEDCAICFVHAINPWGMAWLRRVNENNADLNRNFLPLGEEYAGEPKGYAEVNALLNPKSPPSRREFILLKAVLHILKHGWSSTKQAIAEGQYTRPKAIQYGGDKLLQGPSLLLDWMEKNLIDIKRIVALDMHTGLGKFGEDTLLVDYKPNTKKYTKMLKHFGNRIQTNDPIKGISYIIRGGLHVGFASRWTKINWTCITQEFGTYSTFKVLKTLRAENRWTQWGNAQGIEEMRHWSRIELLNTFSPKSDKWREMILRRGRILFEEGLEFVNKEATG